MAEFTPKKIVLGDINNGIEFTESDGVTPNAINDPIEAVAYAQTVVEHLTDTPDTSEINGTGEPNVSFVSGTAEDGVTIHKFKFSNLSGATFTPSLDEAGNLSWSNNHNLPNPPTINISGRDYLFSSEVLSGTSIPQVNSEVTDIPLTSFNRAPVDDIDHCYLFYYYTPENIYYWLATQVVDIQKTTATLKILSVVRLTGYTPTIGKNGNWVINGEDTGKPSYGASGVTDVVAGTSYTQNDFTITPLTFNFEVGNSKTVNVKAAIGNVEDGSYAKLAQVVRTDTAQSLTDEQKTQAQNNMGLDNKYAKQTGRYPNLKSGGNTVVDTRSVNSPPSYYANQETCYEFKSADTLGLADYMPNSTFVLLTTKKGWVDNNYVVYQEAVSAGNDPSSVTDSVKCYRYGLGETWGEWQVVAKTSQVVRVDAAQALTTDERNQGAANINIPQGVVFRTTVGWTKAITISFTDDYYGGGGFAFYFAICGFNVYNTLGHLYISGETSANTGIIFRNACYYGLLGTSSFSAKDIRVVKEDGKTLQVYINSRIAYELFNIRLLASYSSPRNHKVTIQRTNADEPTGDNVYTPTGLPVLIGDQSAIFESDGVTVKKATHATNADKAVVVDTRSVNSPPSYYYGAGSKITSEFKNCSTVGLPSDETYCTVVTVCPWSDDSGGAVTQTAYVGDKVHIRKSTSDSQWGSWVPVLVGSSVWSETGTSGSVKLPGHGWYCINYRTLLGGQWYSTGVFYWNGDKIYLPVSAYLFNSIVTKRAVNILSDGTVTVFDPDSENPTSLTDFTVNIYKLA